MSNLATNRQRTIHLARWPFFLGDALLVAAAVTLAMTQGGPLAWPEMLVIVLAVALGALLGSAPYAIEAILRSRAAVTAVGEAGELTKRLHRLEFRLAELEEIGRSQASASPLAPATTTATPKASTPPEGTSDAAAEAPLLPSADALFPGRIEGTRPKAAGARPVSKPTRAQPAAEAVPEVPLKPEAATAGKDTSPEPAPASPDAPAESPPEPDVDEEPQNPLKTRLGTRASVHELLGLPPKPAVNPAEATSDPTAATDEPTSIDEVPPSPQSGTLMRRALRSGTAAASPRGVHGLIRRGSSREGKEA